MGNKHARYAWMALALSGAIALLGLIQTVTWASPPGPQIEYPPLPEPDPAMSPERLASQVALSSLPDPADPIPLPEPAWRIGVITDGLYALSYATLNAAGVPVADADPAAYRLFWRGQEVALDASDVGDTFEPGEAFYFYGEKFHGSTQDEKYTDENVYWLTVDATTPGLRMATRDVTPNGLGTPVTWYTETLHAEENLIWWSRWSTTPGTDATWFWDDVTASSPVTRSYSVTLSDLAAGSHDAMLIVELAGRTTNAHRVRFTLNGTVVGEATWSGDVGHVATLPFSATALVEGQNTLDMAILTDSGAQRIYLNWFEIRYPRKMVSVEGALEFGVELSGTVAVTLTEFSTSTLQLYDVSEPLTPTRLIGGEITGSGGNYQLAFQDMTSTEKIYLATETDVARSPGDISSYTPSADWLNPGAGADLIVFATSTHFTAVQPLIEQRRAQGMRVQLVDVADAYALFNGGIVHPEAIRAFVTYAYTHWPGPSPQYILLVGDASFNLKGYNEAAYGPWTPPVILPYLDFIDPDQGEVPVDAYFGDTTGDGLPELAVGRIPAYTPEDVAGFVNKILAYENRPPADWMKRALFVADDGKTSIEGFASTLNHLMAEYVPSTLLTHTVYIQDYCGLSGACPAATEALTQTWGQEAILLTYAGHGSIHRWAHEPLLLNEQLATLPPMEGLPFIISLDCWDGYWLFPPIYPSLGSQDVRSIGEWATTVLTDRGAIGLFGPAGLGYLYIEDDMADAMYDAMFNGGIFRLGDLTHPARRTVSSSYLARTYSLLGDPTLMLSVWDSLTATPSGVTLTVNTQLTLPETFDVTGTTHYGDVFTITPTWTVNDGTLNAWGLFTAPTEAGYVTLTAHLGQFSVPISIRVLGEPVSMTVSPDPLKIGAGLTATLHAEVIDAWGNILNETPTWSADVGEIHPMKGVFTAPLQPTQGHITATLGTLDDAITVEVQAREPTTVSVTPALLQLPVGATQQMTATVTDRWGNPLPNATVLWSTDVGVINAQGVFTADSKPGEGWITATSQSAIGRAAVTVYSYNIYLPLTIRN
ncbi:MAG: C25 family cysteine peptidase [Anaerolineae bacterium]